MFYRLVNVEPDGRIYTWMETAIPDTAIAFGSTYVKLCPETIVMLEEVSDA